MFTRLKQRLASACLPRLHAAGMVCASLLSAAVLTIAPTTAEAFVAPPIHPSAPLPMTAVSADLPALDTPVEQGALIVADEDGNLYLAVPVSKNPYNGATVYALSPLGLCSACGAPCIHDSACGRCHGTSTIDAQEARQLSGTAEVCEDASKKAYIAGKLAGAAVLIYTGQGWIVYGYAAIMAAEGVDEAQAYIREDRPAVEKFLRSRGYTDKEIQTIRIVDDVGQAAVLLGSALPGAPKSVPSKPSLRNPFDDLPVVRPRSVNAVDPVESVTLNQDGLAKVELDTPYVYVVDESGNLLAAVRGSSGRTGVKHTQLTEGEGARVAGEIEFKPNKVVKINNQSGRYVRQSPDGVNKVAEQLRKAGYTVEIVDKPL